MSFSINKELVISAPVESVFSALTCSEEIPKYYPLQSVESDWAIGSSILNRGEANGVAFTELGLITELSKPNLFSYEYWSDNHGTERAPSNQVTITYPAEIKNQGAIVNAAK